MNESHYFTWMYLLIHAMISMLASGDCFALSLEDSLTSVFLENEMGLRVKCWVDVQSSYRAGCPVFQNQLYGGSWYIAFAHLKLPHCVMESRQFSRCQLCRHCESYHDANLPNVVITGIGVIMTTSVPSVKTKLASLRLWDFQRGGLLAPINVLK